MQNNGGNFIQNQFRSSKRAIIAISIQICQYVGKQTSKSVVYTVNPDVKATVPDEKLQLKIVIKLETRFRPRR